VRKLNDILFWCGIIFSIAGFVIGQAQRIPVVLSIVSPHFTAAMVGADRLLKTGSLAPGDRGFAEVELIYVQRLQRINPSAPLTAIQREYGGSIIKFTFEPSLHPIGDVEYGSFVGERIKVLTPAKEIEWHKRGLLASLDTLRDKNILCFALSFFIFGQVVSILSWLHKKRLQVVKNDVEQHPKSDKCEIHSDPKTGVADV
jgi:hypothetical protein